MSVWSGTMNSSVLMCYSSNMITSNGAWVGRSFTQVVSLYSYPLLIIQVSLLVVFTRALSFALKPLRQPRVIAEMLSGLVIGPSFLGRYEIDGFNIGKLIFPKSSIVTMETLARLGLLYYLFTVGVGIDLEAIKRTGRKAVVIAGVDIVLPFTLSVIVAPYLLRQSDTASLEEGKAKVMHVLAGTNSTSPVTAPTAASVATNSRASEYLMGIALSITSIPVLARILTDARILNTELGRLALSSAIVNNLFSWLLLALIMASFGISKNVFSVKTVGVIGSAAAFVLFLTNVVRPWLKWVARRTHEGRPLHPQYMGLILIGVAVSSCTIDAIGLHPAFGAFLFGLVVPNGPLAVKALEITEESGLTYLMPLYFANNGFKMDAFSIHDFAFARGVAVIFVVASCAKVAGIILITRFYGMPIRRGIALGCMMNTKGIVHMLILNMGIEQKVWDIEALPVFIILSVVITSMVPPIVLAVEKPSKRQLARHRRRNVQLVMPGTELRVLACLHAVKNVPSLISLLDASNATKRSPIFVHALHLIELVGRATAMLIVHQNDGQEGRARGSGHAESEHVISALEQYEQHAGGVSVQMLTAIAPYATMHEDVCALAEEKRVSLIVLPFHKQPTGDGGDRRETSSITTVNQNVLSSARCSVAILVDRGLSGAGWFRAQNQPTAEVAILFFGGPDDREALTFSSRMAEHPNIGLTVLRFLHADKSNQSSSDDHEEKVYDDHCMNAFRQRHVRNESVVYEEKVVENSEEVVAAIRSIHTMHDLYVVGRGIKSASPLTAGLEEWSECPELGPIGDLLASSDFGALVSVLVFQQYVVESAEDAAESPRRLFGSNTRGWNGTV